MDKRKNRKTYEGTVISDKMDKTVVVLIKKKVRHPIYEKLVSRFKKFYVHDEKNEAKKGQKVVIMECRPLSKTKKFRMIGIK